MVLVKTDDGKVRPVTLPGKQASQVKGFITHIQGGTLHLRAQEITEEEFALILKSK